MSQDDSRELTRKSTRGILILHLAGSLGLGDEPLTLCVRGSVPRLGDSRGAGQPKESRERRAELWESALGMGRVEGYRRTTTK